MCEYNENDLRNGIHTFDDAEQEELYYKMLHTLFYRASMLPITRNAIRVIS